MGKGSLLITRNMSGAGANGLKFNEISSNSALEESVSSCDPNFNFLETLNNHSFLQLLPLWCVWLGN